MCGRIVGLIALLLAIVLLAGIALIVAPTPPSTPLGQAARTLDELDAAIADALDDATLYVERGKLHLLAYEWDRALADFDRAIELAPQLAEAYYQRGLLYASAPDGSDETRSLAIADFRRFLELAPDDAHAARADEYIRQLEAALGG
ncbi:MAG: tetratricopeptide repeat protein [Anaerolineae bacterium]|nr:tetratricopeptide repeat protein [Anaerolineae bacterium]